MKSTILVFPGTNRERDMADALEIITGRRPTFTWHQETTIEDTDLIVLPGGFSYGDYLRSGAIAARSNIISALMKAADKGVPILGVCNGFQILTETGLLPGVLMRNAGLKFVCKTIELEAVNTDSVFSASLKMGEAFPCPVAHHDGNYFADDATIDHIEKNGQVLFRYANGTNPNGSRNDIAGVLSENKRIAGLMPHPENLVRDLQGGISGRGIFESLLAA